jgi:hypothetical protein
MFNKKLTKPVISDLLKNMLNFNPYFRMTAIEAYTSLPIFDNIRDKTKEAGLKKMKDCKKYFIELPIDSTDAFDYEDASKAKYSVP